MKEVIKRSKAEERPSENGETAEGPLGEEKRGNRLLVLQFHVDDDGFDELGGNADGIQNSGEILLGVFERGGRERVGYVGMRNKSVHSEDLSSGVVPSWLSKRFTFSFKSTFSFSSDCNLACSFNIRSRRWEFSFSSSIDLSMRRSSS